MSLTATVGLEIHAELQTKTKMFCGCLNDPDERTPNMHVCPVCLAHPGSLPVINKDAVQKVLRVGAALGAKLADYTEFDRKNYFYPDIPKGYQISQYQYPLVRGGVLNGITITRIHLEEDTARSQHVEDSDNGGKGERSFVDFNRAGVPLMELVTEPVIHDAKVAGDFARELQLLLRALGAGEANMEKGEMRVEANISVGKDGVLGTKVEVKNLNSFRSVERAIAFEVERQTALIEKGEAVVQETRGWDEVAQKTFSQRKKESSHDYRYFPDPDLPTLSIREIAEFSLDTLRAQLPELPHERRNRYTVLGLKEDDTHMFAEGGAIGSFFDTILMHNQAVALLAANYVATDIAGALKASVVKEEWLMEEENAKRFAALMEMIQRGELSSRGAKDTLIYMYTDKRSPQEIAQEKGLAQENDRGALMKIASDILAANPQAVEEYKKGKVASLQFLIGQGMRASKGSANPDALKEVLLSLLG